MNNLVFGGLLIARTALRSSYMSAELVPWRLISTSECIAATAPGPWALDWVTESPEARLEALRKFGLPDDRLDEIIAWTAAKFDRGINWPGTFDDLETARDFLERFVPPNLDVRLLARCISHSDLSSFLERAVAALGADQAEHAAITIMRRELVPPSDGIELGTDVLGIEHTGDFHSFLCNGQEKLIADQLASTTNEIGLYDDHETGQKAAILIEQLGGAEPVPWFAFRILEYARHAP